MFFRDLINKNALALLVAAFHLVKAQQDKEYSSDSLWISAAAVPFLMLGLALVFGRRDPEQVPVVAVAVASPPNLDLERRLLV